MRASGVPSGEGFTLVELLVATTITVVALGLAFGLLAPTGEAFRTLPDAIDSQQRVRVAALALADDIAAAGAGPALGWGAAAVASWPAVLPCRWTGAPLGTLPGGCARSDAITLITLAAAAPQGMIAQPAGVAEALRMLPLSACALSRAACRMQPGSRALLVDGTGRWDIVPITGVSGDGTAIAHDGYLLSRPASEGSLLGEVTINVYGLRADADTGVMQLRRGTGAGPEFPVADHVTALSFDYFGEAVRPAVVDTGAPGGRTTTYGPVPPPLEVDDPADAWPAGENCVFSSDGLRQPSRLAELVPDAHGLAPVPPAALVDGPWCPDAASPNRWDADLLRIRLVRVTLRVEATAPSRLAPDSEVRLEAALRNRTR